MATHDTVDNGRTEMTRQTLESLKETVDFTRHQLMISDNGSCEATHALYERHHDIISKIVFNGENIGTANALNRLWRDFTPRHGAVCKIDNDVRWYVKDWPDMMQEVFHRDPTIGIIGLKRKDLWEYPDHPDAFFRSALRMLPHKDGERWLIVEEVQHVMGTCQAYSYPLFTRIGYLYQFGQYGLDDTIASYRAHLAGYKTAFLHIAVEIDHLDPGGTPYTDWKREQAGLYVGDPLNQLKERLRTGKSSIYYDGGFGKEKE